MKKSQGFGSMLSRAGVKVKRDPLGLKPAKPKSKESLKQAAATQLVEESFENPIWIAQFPDNPFDLDTIMSHYWDEDCLENGKLYSFSLPMPISGNSITRIIRGHVVSSQSSVLFKTRVKDLLWRVGFKPDDWRYRIEVHLFGLDVRADTDNRMKALKDAMEDALYLNDRQIEDERVIRKDIAKSYVRTDQPHAVIHVWKCPFPAKVKPKAKPKTSKPRKDTGVRRVAEIG